MSYSGHRIVHDADSHIMEPPTWLRDHADPDIRDRIPVLTYSGTDPADDEAMFDDMRSQHASNEFRVVEDEQIMSRKNFEATGSFIAADRSTALDLLGFSSQLVFSTFYQTRLHEWEQGDDLGFAYGAARAHNRGMVDFCSADPRLLPTCYVPLADFDLAASAVEEAIEMGAAALLVASGCPRGHSPSHIGLDAVWARAQEANIPLVFHVGGTGRLLDPAYFNNGNPLPPYFQEPDEDFRSLAFMGIPGPPALTLAAMIFDGVLDRFPDLRIGVIEQGAIWVPSWVRQMDAALEFSELGVFGPIRVLGKKVDEHNFARQAERLQRLSLRPSDYVRRQIRFTPYPTEDVRWIIEQTSPELYMFSSDYPHFEGCSTPIERFEASLGEVNDEMRQRFYSDNFIDFIGARVPSVPPNGRSPHEKR